MKLRDLDWSDWFYALMNATIGGGAASVSGWLGTIAAHEIGINVPSVNLNTLWIYWLSGSATSLFFYLKQSPLPKVISDTTSTITVKETVTSNPSVSETQPPKP